MKRPTCSYYNEGQDQHNTLPARGYPATLVKHTLGSWLCHPGVVMLLRSGAFGMNCHLECFVTTKTVGLDNVVGVQPLGWKYTLKRELQRKPQP